MPETAYSLAQALEPAESIGRINEQGRECRAVAPEQLMRNSLHRGLLQLLSSIGDILLLKALMSVKEGTGSPAGPQLSLPVSSDCLLVTVSDGLKALLAAFNLFEQGILETVWGQDGSTASGRDLPAPEVIYLQELKEYITQNNYITCALSAEEVVFLVAYIMTLNKEIKTFQQLFRDLYMPQNVYCVHMDAKARFLDQHTLDLLVWSGDSYSPDKHFWVMLNRILDRKSTSQMFNITKMKERSSMHSSFATLYVRTREDNAKMNGLSGQEPPGMKSAELSSNWGKDTKVGEEDGGSVPGTRAEIPLKPLVMTVVRKANSLQQTEIHSGANIHLQPMEDPTPE
ncbi:hypothetical protein BTVI_63977 [Pitangus sulphuratus]|nr:hypothetical protein BTVI_63977 [Pitangus sulphuratus]